MRRLLAVLVPLLLLAACGDDDGAADGPTTTVAGTEAPAEGTGTEAGDGEEGATEGDADQAPSETTVADGGAQDGPAGDAGEGDGMGDAVLATDLASADVVPGPGQTGATGRFEAELVDGTLCVDMALSGLGSAVTEAHVHSGRSGEEGPVVVEIGPPSATGDGSATWSDVCTGVGDDVIEGLAEAPELAYVDVHTGDLPDGAVRGQLEVISVFDRTLD